MEYFDDKKRLVCNIKYMSGGFKNKAFVCSTCYKEYLTPFQCKRHASKCLLDWHEFIYENNNIAVCKLTNKSLKKLRQGCENLAHFSKLEQGLDFTQVRYNSINENNPVFVCLKDGALIGYIAFSKKNFKGKNGEFEVWCVIDFYVVATYRRKGFGSLLFGVALNVLKRSPKELFYSSPITTPFKKFLKSKGLEKVCVYSKGVWSCEFRTDI